MHRKLITVASGLVGLVLLALLGAILSDHLIVPGPASARVAANPPLDHALNSLTVDRNRLALVRPTPMPTVLVMLLPTTRPPAAPTPLPAVPSSFMLDEPAQTEQLAPAETSYQRAGTSLNGVLLSQVVFMPAEVRAHVRDIFSRGQALGRDPRAFSKVGDSTMVWPPFLADFASFHSYRLGPYEYLQPAIDHFQDSYARQSVATKQGMHSWTEFDPTWANPARCGADEGPLECELRLHNPSVAIIRLGANDAGSTELFSGQMRRIVEFCLERGIIPVLGTKPDRIEGPDNTLNRTVQGIAAEYRLPLWDYDLIAATVPQRGLEPDQVHMRLGDTHDFDSPAAYQSGDPLEDLTALMVLDVIRQETTPTSE